MYLTEEQVLAKGRELLSKENLTLTELKEEFAFLLGKYELLYNDTKFLTKIGDRLQHKLDTINETLIQKTLSLEKAQETIVMQNNELKAAKQNLEENVLERTVKLNEAYTDLIVINKELDTFVYRASHDIRGPIATLMGLSSLGKRESKEPQLTTYFEMMYKTASNMNDLLARLLSINRLKRSLPSPTRVEVEQLVNTAYQRFAENTSLEEISFISNFEEDSAIDTDGAILDTLFFNLLDLAIRSVTFNLSRVPLIKVSGKKNAKNDLEILFSYSGEPIPPHVIPKIFDMFYRIHTVEESTGIELYVARLAATQLSGTLDLMSSDEQLTSFLLVLPNIKA